MDLINAVCSSDTPASEAGCVALRNQRRLAATDKGGADPYEGWGESDVAEIEIAMHFLWKDVEGRRELGKRGARVIRERFSWERYREILASEVMKHCK
mmetsp:Transcript_1720/g.4133  ORF Transcript_1720/g.4133 Transcript_1720/m.4133 type:complete len:98 (+) Transcript_1720:136-429(+)